MTIYNRTTRQETRFAKVTGSGGVENARRVTLDDLEAFLVAARSENIPGETAIEGPSLGPFGSGPIGYLQAQAVVTEEGTD